MLSSDSRTSGSHQQPGCFRRFFSRTSKTRICTETDTSRPGARFLGPRMAQFSFMEWRRWPGEVVVFPVGFVLFLATHWSILNVMSIRLSTDGKYKVVFPDVAVRTMLLNHGHNTLGQYASAAFFIRHEPSLREFLFFGDVEPDSIADKPLTINVWHTAAPKFPELLSTIFIECSYPSGRKDDLLFGHLTPEHLVTELSVFATEVVKYKRDAQLLETWKCPPRKKPKRNSLTAEDLRGALAGLRVFITHCKDDMTGPPIWEIIVDQVRSIVDEKGLGAKILVAEQGMRIGASNFNLLIWTIGILMFNVVEIWSLLLIAQLLY